MDLKKPEIIRKSARVVAVLAVALAAGHLVQSMSKPDHAAEQDTDLAQYEIAPATIVPLAAGATDQTAAVPSKTQVPVALPIESAEPPAMTEPQVVQNTDAQTADPAPVAESCPVSLEAFAESSAMISLTLTAPCRPNQRIVLRHAGLAITENTTARGALFTAIPALDKAGLVEIMFADGTKISSSTPVPELAALRRFGVQWQGDDAFQVHAFENGADYGQPGDVSAANPQRPVAGLASTSGFLTLLGNSDAEDPLMAEIYTYPADSTISTNVTIEAAVTAKTCGRDLLGDTLSSVAGEPVVTELTLSMPECSAIGDTLVLNNLAPDLKITAAN